VTPGETLEMLQGALDKQSEKPVEDWLAEQGIDAQVFADFINTMILAMRKQTPFVLLGAGFGLGWSAHQARLATPVETGPAPDLSDSLE